MRPSCTHQFLSWFFISISLSAISSAFQLLDDGRYELLVGIWSTRGSDEAQSTYGPSFAAANQLLLSTNGSTSFSLFPMSNATALFELADSGFFDLLLVSFIMLSGDTVSFSFCCSGEWCFVVLHRVRNSRCPSCAHSFQSGNLSHGRSHHG